MSAAQKSWFVERYYFEWRLWRDSRALCLGHSGYLYGYVINNG